MFDQEAKLHRIRGISTVLSVELAMVKNCSLCRQIVPHIVTIM